MEGLSVVCKVWGSPSMRLLPSVLTPEKSQRFALGGLSYNPRHLFDLEASLKTRHVSVTRKVDVRLTGKGNSNSHGARPVHQKHRWIWTSRLSIKNYLSLARTCTRRSPVIVGSEMLVRLNSYLEP